jgi:hypothetical protein
MADGARDACLLEIEIEQWIRRPAVGVRRLFRQWRVTGETEPG